MTPVPVSSGDCHQLWASPSANSITPRAITVDTTRGHDPDHDQDAGGAQEVDAKRPLHHQREADFAELERQQVVE